jgi:hypothetical protein
MDALEFFRLITPEYGIHYLACFKVGYKIPTHAAYTDLATMVADARQFARSSELQVYHACASYLKPCIELEDGKKKYRVDDNWDRARSFWIDIDCGQEKFDAGKGYLTKRDATQAIFGFCDTIGWPKPLVVSSGNGIHAYWPLTKDIKSEAWVAVATILKATLAHQKVLADPSRTSDFASILRTPETFNRKNGERKEVRVLVSGSVTDPSELAVALQRFVKENKVPLLREVKKKSLKRSRNADMLAGMFPVMQSSLDEAANKCAQLGAFRDSQGSGNYEVFRGVVGVA